MIKVVAKQILFTYFSFHRIHICIENPHYNIGDKAICASMALDSVKMQVGIGKSLLQAYFGVRYRLKKNTKWRSFCNTFNPGNLYIFLVNPTFPR